MELNWVRIVAQLLNLFLLVYLLSRFLFRPITAIMAERERRITAGLKQGQQLVAEGRDLADEYSRRLSDLQQEKERLLEQARQEADAEKQELLAQARRAADAAKRHFHASLEQEKDAIYARLQEEIISHACGLANRVLTELADSTLEERALSLLVKRLSGPESEQLDLPKAGLSLDPRVVVTTGHPLGPEARASLEAAIVEVCRPEVPVIEFVVSDELVFGAAIQTVSSRLEWNAADYLRQAEQGARQEVLKHEATRKEAGGPHA